MIALEGADLQPVIPSSYTKVVAPALTPVIIPESEIIATVVSLLIQEPPVVGVIEADSPIHMLDVLNPFISGGPSTFILIDEVPKHPFVNSMKVKSTVPAFLPVTTP